MYVKAEREDEVLVYSTFNGELLRILRLPSLALAAATNDHELFFSLDTEDGDGSPLVGAYCLPGY